MIFNPLHTQPVHNFQNPAIIATPYHDMYFKGVARRGASDESELSCMMPSMEVLIGAERQDHSKDYFGNCEQRVREISSELKELGKNV